MKKRKIVRRATAVKRTTRNQETISPVIAFGAIFIIVAALILWAYVGKLYG